MTELLLTSEQIGQLVAQFFIAGAGTLSFAVLFASPKRTLPYCGLVGAMGWFIYELAVLFGLESFAASLLAVIPLTLLARIFAIVLTTGEVSIPAVIGFISLFGIATRNGMLLITEYKRLRSEEGKTVRDAIVEGSLSRLNPILMTALTSALALVPLALGGDLPGNEIQSPMAKVILGGLISSTLLNAFIVPIIYEKISNRNNSGVQRV